MKYLLNPKNFCFLIKVFLTTSCSIVQDSVLHCSFNKVTSGTIIVTVSDGELSDMETMIISIIPDPIENTAPYWNSLTFNYKYNIDLE